MTASVESSPAEAAALEEPVPGGAGYRLVVREVVHETPDARSVVFEVPTEHAERFRYAPGQFLTVRLPGTDGVQAARCYSLASAPDVDPYLTVTVKRVAGGRVSTWICESLQPGQEVDVLPPAGRFTPRSLSEDLLLVAGGSGITPLLSIARSVLGSGTGSIVLIYANRDEQSVIFAERLRELAERHPDRLLVLHQLETVEGRPTPARLRALLAPFAGRPAAFVCGPTPFMDAVAEVLRGLGMPRDRVMIERFVSLSSDPFVVGETPGSDADPGDAATVGVTLDGEHHQLAWPRTTPLLEVLLAAGLEAPFSCREGACSACACRVDTGEVVMMRNDVLEAEDLDEGWVLGCQALPGTDSVEVTYDG